jgi:hypothetical protein
MKMKYLAAVGVLLIGLISDQALAANASATLTVTILSPLAISFNPSSASISCSAPAGTVITAITSSGGDSKSIGVTLTGDTSDFALSTATLPANVIVGQNGIAAANCGKSNSVTVTATQS